MTELELLLGKITIKNLNSMKMLGVRSPDLYSPNSFTNYVLELDGSEQTQQKFTTCYKRNSTVFAYKNSKTPPTLTGFRNVFSNLGEMLSFMTFYRRI